MWARFAVVLLMLCPWMTSADLEVVILHTGDVHSRVEQTNAFGGNCSDEDAASNQCYGGVARRATVIEQIRNDDSNVILLDAGDAFQGTVWFSYYDGLELIHFMNRMHYDVMTLGNHEFDKGVAGLVTAIQNATFPMLACNLDTSREPRLAGVVKPYTLLNVSGETIGVVGYVTTRTPFITHPDNVATLAFLDEVTSIRRYVDELRGNGVNKIIVLGHGGFDEGLRIARDVAGVDIVIEGQTNTFLYNGDAPDSEVPAGPYPTVVTRDDGDQALVYSAYAYGKYLGKAKVTFDDAGRVTEWSGNPLLLDGTYQQNPLLLAEVERWREPLSNFTNVIVADSLVMLDGQRSSCRRRECNLGNLITDAVLDQFVRAPAADETGWSDVAIVMINGGSIRTSVPAGPVSIGNMLGVLPFGNEVDKVAVQGRVIRQMLEHSVTEWEEVSGRFLQFSGVHVVYDLSKPEGSRVVEVMVRCADCEVPHYHALDDGQEYRILTSDFLVKGGDGYTMLRDNILEQTYYGTVVVDAVMAYMGRVSPVWPGEEGRIRFDTSVSPCPPQSGSAPTISRHVSGLVAGIAWVVISLLNL